MRARLIHEMNIPSGVAGTLLVPFLARVSFTTDPMVSLVPFTMVSVDWVMIELIVDTIVPNTASILNRKIPPLILSVLLNRFLPSPIAELTNS